MDNLSKTKQILEQNHMVPYASQFWSLFDRIKDQVACVRNLTSKQNPASRILDMVEYTLASTPSIDILDVQTQFTLGGEIKYYGNYYNSEPTIFPTNGYLSYTYTFHDAWYSETHPQMSENEGLKLLVAEVLPRPEAE